MFQEKQFDDDDDVCVSLVVEGLLRIIQRRRDIGDVRLSVYIVQVCRRIPELRLN